MPDVTNSELPPPPNTFARLLYNMSFGQINLGDEQRAAAQAANDENGLVDYASTYYGTYVSEAWSGFSDWAEDRLKAVINGLYLYGGLTSVMMLRMFTHGVFSLVNDVLGKGVEDTFRLPDPTIFTVGTFSVATDFGTSTNISPINCSVRAWNHGNAPSVEPETTMFRNFRWHNPTVTSVPSASYSTPYKPFIPRTGGSL